MGKIELDIPTLLFATVALGVAVALIYVSVSIYDHLPKLY